MCELRTFDKLNSTNVDIFLYIKLSLELGLSYEEMKKVYVETLKKAVKDEAIQKKRVNKLYRTYYTHFRNKIKKNESVIEIESLKSELSEVKETTNNQPKLF